MLQKTIHSIQSTNMSSRKGQKRYEEFNKLVRRVYPTLEKVKQYKKGQELWQKVKGDNTEFNKMSLELKAKATVVSSVSIKFWTTTVSSPLAKKKATTTSVPTLDITTVDANPVATEDADLVSNNSNNGRQKKQDFHNKLIYLVVLFDMTKVGIFSFCY